MKKFFAVIVLLVLVPIPFASAHPFVVETYPNSDSNAPVGTTRVYVVYSESIELDFSSLKVFDIHGEQVDNRDTQYYTDEESLLVTTAPLQDGIYTVSSKVLSRVDGHLVPDAFVFAVGSAELLPEHSGDFDSEAVLLPEAAVRFPGLVGQTVVLGAVVASLFIWGTQNKQLIRDEIDKLKSVYHAKFMAVTGVGLALVVASNILVLAVQTWRLESSVLDTIQTTFGTTWLARMVLAAALVGVWFWMTRNPHLTGPRQAPMLVLALALAATTTLMGHSTAAEQLSAVVLDYVHNLVAAVWIGGVIFFAFALLPALSSLEAGKKERMSLVVIPRFSIAFVIAVGVVIITGPTLMWLLESDMGVIVESTYGKLIMAKVSIAAAMVALGGFAQSKIQQSGEKAIQTKSPVVHRRLQRSLRTEVVLGVALLGVVALLANGTLPAGEVQRADAQGSIYGYVATEFSGDVRFDIEISPFAPGNNAILVTVSDAAGGPVTDSEELNVRISNPQKGIYPTPVEMGQVSGGDGPRQFYGDVTFGFLGTWQVAIEAPRTENANETVVLVLQVKPRLADLAVEIVEYDLPAGAMPLYPLYDKRDSIWLSDSAEPRLWKFDLEAKQFEPLSFEGSGSVWLARDDAGRVWFTDTEAGQIGYAELETGKIATIGLPELAPADSQNIPTSIQPDGDGNVWIAIINKDALLRYDPESDAFETVALPAESRPFALAADNSGRVWFTASETGTIGYVEPGTYQVREFVPEPPLESPEYLLFGNDDAAWISEHGGNGIARFDAVLETFERIPMHSGEGLPFGMSFDMYGNIWVALHTVDMIAAYDPYHDAEQRGNKLAMIKTTELAPSVRAAEPSNLLDLEYTDVASPLIALGILATSMFYVKGIHDKRRLNELVRG